MGTSEAGEAVVSRRGGNCVDICRPGWGVLKLSGPLNHPGQLVKKQVLKTCPLAVFRLEVEPSDSDTSRAQTTYCGDTNLDKGRSGQSILGVGHRDVHGFMICLI